MPELPEVETVRQGLERHLVGRRLDSVEVRHPRAVRNNPEGPKAVELALTGAGVDYARRRGKFMWFELDQGPESLLVHLGMSGQMLIKDERAGEQDPNFKHLRIRARLDDGSQLWFVDQRTFGYWWAGPLDHGVPLPVGHIAPDLMDLSLDIEELARRLKAKPTQIKRLLLDQEVVSGIGNIYADEMLWQAGIHPRQRANRLAVGRIITLLEAGRDVLGRALTAGGTSFDELYVNVNGQSGYFDRSLNAYGRTGKPCPRCGTPIVREHFANRSSHFCPHCQRAH